MKVRYQLHVPVWVEVDLHTHEVTRVNVMDDAPVGGWRAVHDSVEFYEGSGFTNHSRHVDYLTGGEQMALQHAFEISDGDNDIMWPAWEWGW